MGLRAQAAADLRTILTDEAGFGWPITLIPPDGGSVSLVGLSTDISETIDPETGMAVLGRKASVALAIADLDEIGVGIPKGVASSSEKPWAVMLDDIRSNCMRSYQHTFKIIEAKPDLAIGVVVCTLEVYKPKTT